MKVNIKKLNKTAVIPRYANSGDAGLDLTATSMRQAERFIEYGTGLAMEIPEGHVGLVFPRSSVSKTGLTLCNSVGVIDSTYRGEIKLRFYLTNDQVSCYSIGDRVGQIMIVPYPQVQFEEVTELMSTNRGEGGFGSTGN